jgi:hypothetical protein
MERRPCGRQGVRGSELLNYFFPRALCTLRIKNLLDLHILKLLLQLLLSGGNREVVPQDPTGKQTWEIDMVPNSRYEAYVVCKWEPITVTSGLNRFLLAPLDMERHFDITKFN